MTTKPTHIPYAVKNRGKGQRLAATLLGVKGGAR
jgi:hypothetical protein